MTMGESNTNTFDHTHPVRVYWEDTDAQGVVYYANYLRFYERVRSQWFSATGLDQWQMKQSMSGVFVVSEVHMRYLAPARLNDDLTVTVKVLSRTRTSLLLEQKIFKGDAAQGQVLNQAQIRAVWVTSDAHQQMKSQRIPSSVVQALRVAEI